MFLRLSKTMTHSNYIESILQSEPDPAFEERARFILDSIVKNKSANILDVGCGRGFYVRLFSLLEFPKKIVGVDQNKIYLNKAGCDLKNDKRVRLMQGSIYHLPFDDNSFDTVVASEIFEHLNNPQTAIEECSRVLKKDGQLIITVPHKNFPFFWDPINFILMKLFNTHVPKHIWWLAGIWADHKKLYKEEEIKDLLSKKKFKVIRSKRIVAHSYPFAHFLLYGIGKNLIEKFNLPTFDRFNFNITKKPSPFVKLFKLPSKKWDGIIKKDKRFMNLALVGIKT
ncbi:hypothetical protein A2690_00230 [Candidatus Roizmanbacteria bacterium RIFCSPHIGHO2_01_FULL_39_12b]|uniref:Methyltransferase type 11 domain-containing protein n=1 Tax=Candidatus Roizmanbacteria bacterium RIFCSPHIGHO2_01_FULL_39_12b TaxID=1802030 RepID=A0A1F7G8F3_9BACT|nr:MAG: hypothetical protein A2690_00230 [Candidatus Roizmanbacteria bacterium RIFCSPHIGHO2_01_FULL_39_12b]OGK45994.1 MAG: hypothetical protein A3B46_00520 [Candidatus Roizmanbacteria bacterium RIFCSPLOWO2_01_FULL_39_19]